MFILWLHWICKLLWVNGYFYFHNVIYTHPWTWDLFPFSRILLHLLLLWNFHYKVTLITWRCVHDLFPSVFAVGVHKALDHVSWFLYAYILLKLLLMFKSLWWNNSMLCGNRNSLNYFPICISLIFFPCVLFLGLLPKIMWKGVGIVGRPV